MPVLDVSEELGDFEFDPDDVLASLVPYEELPKSVEPEVLPPDLGEEKPSKDYVTDLGLSDAFRAMTSRIGKELASLSDPAQGAELALAVSELDAMSGAGEEAAVFARKAVDRQPTSRLARIQLRQLSFETGDYQALLPLVTDELAIIKDSDSKAQLVLWHAEFLRLALNDGDAAASVLTSAAADFGSDTQVALLRFLSVLAQEASTSHSLELPELPFVDALVVPTILRIRGGATDQTAQYGHPTAAILEASSALLKGHLERALDGLSPLHTIPNCATALRWLSACLTAHSHELRRKSIEQLLELERTEEDSEVRRALLERAVEARASELLSRLTDVPSSVLSRSANASEQLILSLLCGQLSPNVRDLFENATNDDELVPLAIAAIDLLDRNVNDFSGTDHHTRALLTTARRIANASPTNPVTLPVWTELTDNSDDFVSLDFVFKLEQAYENQDWSALGQLLLDAEDGSGAWSVGDRETLASLFFLAARNESASRSGWEKVLAASPVRESGLRALLEYHPMYERSRLLEAHADGLNLNDDRVPWLLLEAALYSAESAPDAARQYLEHAHAISSDLVLATTMGEDLSRLAGDNGAATEWLSKHADLVDDTSEVALLAVEEALLHHPDDPLNAETCATRAVSAVPADPSLLCLRDYVAPGSPLIDWPLPPDERPSNETLLEAAARAAWAGDWRSANEAAILLSEEQQSNIAEIWSELAASSGQRNSKLFEKLFTTARTETDPEAQRELYERLLRLDPNFGKEGATDLWLNAIVERAPDNLPALRVLERSNARRNRWPELIAISEKLMQHLDRHEAQGYAWLTSALNIYMGSWSNGESATAWATRQRPVPLWALRRQYSYAISKSDWASTYSIQSTLAERAHYAADVTSLRIRNAEIARRQGDMEKALADIRAALDITPDHGVALSLLVTWQLEQGDKAAAAEVLEQIAQVSAVQTHREDALSRASDLWQELGDEGRSEYALEQLLNVNPNNTVAVSRLTHVYRTAEAHDRLAALLERQIENTVDPIERTQLQVERARCLLALDLTIAAEKALEPALTAFPENIDVLQTKADIALRMADYHEAEFTYTRLLKLVEDPARQAELYRKLGTLYEASPEKSDVAESTYRRLLEIVPNDNAALAALVRLSLGRNEVAEAVRLQSQLVENPATPEQQLRYQIELARIHELNANDKRRAEEVLERARRKWPNDSTVLRAFAEFHQRASDSAALQVLLDRSITEARRALHTGRFEVAFFDVFATVAGLRGQTESARVAESIALALRGTEAELHGVGLGATSPRHDEALAPDLLNLPLRAILQRTGWALDSAQPADLGAFKVSSLGDTHAALFDHIAVLADKFELSGLSVWLSSKIGTACIPAQCRPATLVIGQKLLDPSYDSVRDFLLIRALKALQTNTACLARVPAIDVWPLLAAYLGVFLPDWQPPAIDSKRFEDAKQRILTTLASAFTHDMATLAQEVVLALGNRASQVGDAVKEWGSRTALLALGNPADALDALALTANAPPLPKDNAPERVKWVNRHPEARNLLIFAVSDGFLQLRSQLLAG